MIFIDNETKFETPTHFITASNSHANMWIFSSKKKNTFFTIRATVQWIKDNQDVIVHPERVLTRRGFPRFKRRKQD